MANGRTEMKVGADGVAVITIGNPPVNALSIDGDFLLVLLFLTPPPSPHRSGIWDNLIIDLDVVKGVLLL